MIKNILVVCVGNICRSPMAEALLKVKLPKLNASSAGIAALVDYPADPYTINLMREKNIDIDAHRSRQLDSELVFDADLILAMETSHIKHIQSNYLGSTGKVHLIGKWLGNREIKDPFKKDERAFRIAMENIEKGIDTWVDKLQLL